MQASVAQEIIIIISVLLLRLDVDTDEHISYKPFQL